MKKNYSVIFVLLAFIIAIGSFFGKYKINVLAEENSTFQSKSAYLIDAKTKTVIINNNINEKRPIASMCKIMTLLLTFEAIDNGQISIDQSVTVSDNASSMGGSQVFLESGGEYIVGNLIKSIVVASANDACVAIAETICGSEDQFVSLMNEKAKSLSMNNTNFINCTGLPGAGQYSTAEDVAIMFSELIKHEDYFKFSRIWTDKIHHSNDRVTEISNTNKLIRFYEGCDGGKTGYTAEAGHCLVASASRNGSRLIAVVLCSPDSKTRFKEVSSMFNYGFSNYTTKMIVDDSKPLDVEVNVLSGKKEKLTVVAEKPLYIFCKKNEKRSFDFDFVIDKAVKAPVEKGQIVGRLDVYENNVKIDSVNVLSNENVAKKSFFDNLNDLADNWSIIG